METMKITAIIPARGGSKRIPKKNIKDFCGKPIIAYPIEAAINSGLFERVMVSTDDDEIASIAVKFGAEVPFMRSDRSSSDYATTADVIEEVILEYEKRGIVIEEACCMYPTAPFVTSGMLKDAYSKYNESGADSLAQVVAFSYPPQRGLVVRNGYLEMLNPEYRDTRSQDLEKIYQETGQFYFFNVDVFKKEKYVPAGKVFPYIMNPSEVQDIDTMDDWIIAEEKYNRVQFGLKI